MDPELHAVIEKGKDEFRSVICTNRVLLQRNGKAKRKLKKDKDAHKKSR
ncbi:toxin-antitoxin system HicB family antitoxin [Bacillus sp. UFRGS-B20]|nr:toxin-antitoxin system HicB family antitoxin [Bacillus sp. UFRGS-B20]